jgi:hypothetical protein
LALIDLKLLGDHCLLLSVNYLIEFEENYFSETQKAARKLLF